MYIINQMFNCSTWNTNLKIMSRIKENVELTEEEKKAISVYVSMSEKFAKAFFWSPDRMNAASRRSYEKNNSFYFNNGRFTLDFSIEVSCHHYYIRKLCKFNNVEHNCKFLKNLLK